VAGQHEPTAGWPTGPTDVEFVDDASGLQIDVDLEWFRAVEATLFEHHEGLFGADRLAERHEVEGRSARAAEEDDRWT